jgi:hypothetical protein
MPVSVKVGGAWKAAAAVYNKVGGVWKTAADMPVKIGGVWKTGILESGAYESIATATGTGSSATITFSSIPSTYASLQIRFRCSNTNAGTAWSGLLVRFNSDSGANYTRHALSGQGSSASAAGATAQTSAFMDNVVSRAGNTNTLAVGVIDIHDYASTTKNTTVRAIGGIDLNGSGVINLMSNLWINTSAVTSISLISEQNNWATSTVFSLYGIKGA